VLSLRSRSVAFDVTDVLKSHVVAFDVAFNAKISSLVGPIIDLYQEGEHS